MGDINENFDPPVHPLRRSPLFAQPVQAPATSTRERLLRQRIERDQAALAKIEERRERFGPEPEVGSTIVFIKQFPKPSPTNGRSRYPYAALRTDAGWYLTGRETGSKTWDELTEFIGEGKYQVNAPPEQFAQWTSSWAGVAEWAEKLRISVDPTGPQGMIVMIDEASGILGAAAISGHDPLAPFGVRPKGDGWQVIRYSNTFDGAYDTVKEFGGGSGQMRAEQSAASRNAKYRRELLTLNTEPPVGARVRSKAEPNKWARREPGGSGWVRYNGTTIQSVRLSWDSVRRQLGAIEPGTPYGTKLFNDD